MPRTKNIPRRNVRRLVSEPIHVFPGGSQATMLPYSGHPLALCSFRSLRGDRVTLEQAKTAEVLVDALTRINAAYDRYEGANLDRKIIILASPFGDIVSAAVRGTSTAAITAAVLVNPRDVEGSSFITNFRLREEEGIALTRAGIDPGKRDRQFGFALVPDLNSEAEIAIAGAKGFCSIFENKALGELTPAMMLSGKRSFTALGDLFTESVSTSVPELHPDGSVGQRMRGDPTRLGGSNMLNLMLAWAIGSVSHAATIAIVEDEVLIANASGHPSADRAADGAHTLMWLRRTQKVTLKQHHLAAYSNQPIRDPGTLLALTNFGIHLLLAPRYWPHDDVLKRCIVDLEPRLTFVTLPKELL